MAVGAALMLPLVYLVVRTFDAGGGVWDLLFRERILAILGRTVLLVVTVTAASVPVGRRVTVLVNRRSTLSKPSGAQTSAMIRVLGPMGGQLAN